MSSPTPRSRLVRYVEAFANHRYGTWVLAAIAFADSSFLPLVPDILLVPMALVRPKALWWLCFVCTVASTLGAALGYAIGAGLWSLIGASLVEFYGYSEGFEAYQRLVEEWGVWLVIGKAFTPIPFKIMAIAAGVAHMNPAVFMIAALVGRALHFAMIGVLILFFGQRIMVLFEKYEAPAVVVSIVALIGVVLYLHFR
jgi:membrane protein YqaA with SNARE-associated domain